MRATLSSTLSLDNLLRKVREQLASAGFMMETLTELMIVSEISETDDGKIVLIVWLPDLTERGLTFRKKRIIYDPEESRILKMENVTETT